MWQSNCLTFLLDLRSCRVKAISIHLIFQSWRVQALYDHPFAWHSCWISSLVRSKCYTTISSLDILVGSQVLYGQSATRLSIRLTFLLNLKFCTVKVLYDHPFDWHPCWISSQSATRPSIRLTFLLDLKSKCYTTIHSLDILVESQVLYGQSATQPSIRWTFLLNLKFCTVKVLHNHPFAGHSCWISSFVGSKCYTTIHLLCILVWSQVL